MWDRSFPVNVPKTPFHGVPGGFPLGFFFFNSNCFPDIKSACFCFNAQYFSHPLKNKVGNLSAHFSTPPSFKICQNQNRRVTRPNQSLSLSFQLALVGNKKINPEKEVRD